MNKNVIKKLYGIGNTKIKKKTDKMSNCTHIKQVKMNIIERQ